MTAQKSPLSVVLILLAFIAWGAFFPGATKGSVYPETADFGDVVVGSTGAIPLEITNTGRDTLILYFQYENYGCNFSLPPQEFVLQPEATAVVEITWTPPEGTAGSTCSDTLKVSYSEESFEKVLVTGTAVEAGEVKGDRYGTISIGECDTGVGDQLHDGKLISAWIIEYAAEAKNHRQFVRHIFAFTNKLKKAGIISVKDKHAIRKCVIQLKRAFYRQRYIPPRCSLAQTQDQQEHWVAWKNGFPHRGSLKNRP